MSLLIPKFNKFEQCIRVGEYDIVLPDPPNLRDIEGYGLPAEQQMWKAPPRPNRNTMSAAQIKGWEDQMIDKCYETGHWLFINGKIVYMTPAHFMYCGFWPIDIGLPWFRWSNAKFFYLWRDIELDDRCVGLVEITNRRDGKTFRGGFIVYHRCSVTSNTQGGIQSKTDSDAKAVFRKSVVNPFKKLPKFLQPVWDGNTNPRSELNFYAPTKRLADIDEYGLDEALETSINFKPVNAEAYDGEYLAAYFRDEFGKTLAADVHEGHEFTKYCFYKGSDIVGKALYSTTVEEMEKKGGKNAKKLWDESDPEIAASDPLGQTKSNMRRYFKPGYEGMEGRHPVTRRPFIDRFGFDVLGPDGMPIAKSYLDERRRKFEISKDWNGLASEKRKYPFTVEEAFRQDAKDCHFNAEVLQSRLSYLESRIYQENPAYVKGDFLWKNGEPDTEVVWVPNPDGRFLVWKLPPAELRNTYHKDMHGRKVPGNVDLFGAGSDSYDHKKVEDKARASNMAFYVGRKFDAAIDTPVVPPTLWVTRLPWVEYVNRPPRPEDAWEDALKACVFYGCRLFPETNKPGLRNHFENRGYIHYLQDRPDWTYTNGTSHENTKGMASVQPTIEQYVDLLTTWVEDFAAACVFPRLLRHLLEYEIDNTTKFDCAVGWGYTLICLGVRPKKRTPVADINGIAGVLQPTYTNSGVDDSGLRSTPQGFVFNDRDADSRLKKTGGHGFLPDMSFDVGI